MMSSFRSTPAPLLLLLCFRSALVYASPQGEPALESPNAAAASPAAPATGASPAAPLASSASPAPADAAPHEEGNEEAEPAPAPLIQPAGRTTAGLSAYDRGRLEAAARSDEQFNKDIALRKSALGKQLIARGEQLMQHAPFELGGRTLAVAYALEPQPQLLYQIARAYQKANQDSAALAFYLRFVQEAPPGPQQQEARDSIVSLRLEVEAPDGVLDRVIKEHIELGKSYYQSVQYREAAEVYAVAYALKLAPRYLFNIGQGYRRGAQSFPAYVFYQRYLQADPQTPVRRETEGYLVDLRTQINQPAAPSSKRAWVAGGIAIAAGVVAVALGLGLGLGLRSREPATDGGTVVLHF